MDWASTEWKQALTPLAAQKVCALEEKIEKLQKERQQKQLQFECLELTLEKEKRKTEKEKQQNSEVQKELQSLADICKDLENKQQRFQTELQSRESRIKNLEALLSQSRKENSKLQQLENDLKELNCVRENALQVREQKVQKKLQHLEQSISQDNKANISEIERDSGVIGCNIIEHDPNPLIDCFNTEKPLKEIIKEQEEIIKELRTQLSLVSGHEVDDEHSNVFKSPAKVKSTSATDSPAVQGKNAWDVFSSTPAKGNKDRVLGYGDSNSTDSGNQQIMALQTRLKQLHQDRDCERHNSEASKKAMELKYKDSESKLKTDLKYQIQATVDLEKELKESKNKYQQEISQVTRQVDMLTLQLKKSEEAKMLFERDLKSLESKMSMNESKLSMKEEELRDLQKSKNASEVTQHLLQTRIQELEKNCKVLTEENLSLSENIRGTQMQLDGSNNLVKEKEISLYAAQQELTNLQLRMKEMETHSTVQEAKLKETQLNEASFVEQLEFLVQEKKELNDCLNSEMQRNKDAETCVEEQKQNIMLLKDELNKNIFDMGELKNQLDVLSNEYKVQLAELENQLQTAKLELSESTSTGVLLKEKITHLEGTNNELSKTVSVEKDRNNCLKLSLEEETLKMLSVSEELLSKTEELKGFQNQMDVTRNEFESEIHRLNAALKSGKEKIICLETELNNFSSNENNFKEKLELMEQEKRELSHHIESMTFKVEHLELCHEKEKQESSLLKEELESKCIEFDNFESQVKILKDVQEDKIQELIATLNSSEAKITSLETELNTSSSNENNIKGKLLLMEQEMSELRKQLNLKTSEVLRLELCAEKEKEDSSLLIKELESKCVEIEGLNNQIKTLKDESEIAIHTLEDVVCSSKSKITSLEGQLEAVTSNENVLKEELESREKEKTELSDHLKLEIAKVHELKSSIEKEKQTINLLKEKIACYSVQVEDKGNQMKKWITKYEAKFKESEEKIDVAEKEKVELRNQLTHASTKVQKLELSISEEKQVCSCLKERIFELETMFSSAETKSVVLETEVKELSLNKISAEGKVDVVEKEKKELRNELMSATTKIQKLELSIDEEKQVCLRLKEELSNSDSVFEKLNNQIKNLNNLHEERLVELETMFTTSETKIKVLETQLKELCLIKISAEEKVDVVEKEKKELQNELMSATTKIQKLELSIDEEKQVYLEFEKLNNQIKNLKNLHEERVHELETKFSSVEEKCIVLGTQLRDISLNKISANENFEIVEKEKIELLNQLTSATIKIQELETEIEKEKQAFSQLLTDLESKRVDVEFLNSEMKILKEAHEKSMQELEEKLHVSKQELGTSQKQLHETSLMKVSLKETITQLEGLNKELSDNLIIKSDSNECLKQNLEEESQKILSLKQELSSKCSELEELKAQMPLLRNQFENAIVDIKHKLSSTEDEKISLENQIQEHVAEIRSLKQGNDELFENLMTETAKYQSLQLSLEGWKKFVISLEESLCCLSSKEQALAEEISTSQKYYEAKIEELENEISLAHLAYTSLKSQKEEFTVNEIERKHQFELLIKDKENLSSEVREATNKYKQFELMIQEQQTKIEKLKNEVSSAHLTYTSLKSQREESADNEMEVKQQLEILTKEKENLIREAADVSNQKKQFEVIVQEQQMKIQELEDKLSHLETHSTTLELKLKDACQLEISLKDDLLQAEKEGENLMDLLDKKNNEVTTLNSCIENIKKELSSTEEQLSLESEKLKGLYSKEKTIKEYENKIQDLEYRLSTTQSQETDFLSQLQVYAEKEESLTTNLDLLEKKNVEVTEKLNSEIEKTEELGLFVQELTESYASIEKELANKTLLLEEENTLTNKSLNKIQDLESRLFTQEDLRNQLQECSIKEETLKRSLTILEKENIEMSEKLTTEYLKTEKLELLVEELTKSCASCKEELTNKTVQFEEVTGQKINLVNASQRTIQLLQDGICDVQSENVLLGDKVKGYVLNEQILKKKLDAIEEEKQVIRNQLGVEASKVKILETGIGELKRMILSLQVMLLCNNDDTNWAYSKRSASKRIYKDLSCGSNIQSSGEYSFNSPTPIKSICSLDVTPIRYPTITRKKVDFDELTVIQSYKEIEYSRSLHKLAIHLLEEVHLLEQDLITKIEMLKFLCGYKLFEKEEYTTRMWKKYLLTKRLALIQSLKNYLSCVGNILKANVTSCEFDNSKNKLLTSLPEKLHIATQDIFYMCGDTLNKVLFSVSQILQQNKLVVQQCSIYKYSTVHSNHLPLIANTKFVLSLHYLSRTYINFTCKSLKQHPQMKLDVLCSQQNIQKAMCILKAQDMPYFVNYAVLLTEYILKHYSGTKSILPSDPAMTNFSIISSPVLHLLKQYNFNCLNTANDGTIDELNYWQNHCNSLCMTEQDIGKIISLFEYKCQNTVIPSETTKDLSMELNSLKEECSAMKAANEALQNAVLAEKEKQKSLNATIEAIEQDLGETFQQRENYKKMVLKTSLFLRHLKEDIGEANSFPLIQLVNKLSDDSCFCEMCIQHEESEVNSSHETLSLSYLFESIRKLVQLGNQLETELKECNRQEADLTAMYKDLQDKNSELNMAFANLQVDSKNTLGEIENLKYELLKEKECYQHICQAADQKDGLILELESTNSNLLITTEQYKAKVCCCEEKILKLSTDLEELSAVLLSKQGEVDTLRKTMEEEALTFENTQLQCEEYENKVQLLNSTISKYEEEKTLDKHLKDSKSQKTIYELQDKIESLKRSNESLNLTIEAVNEELRAVYLEKQNVENSKILTEENFQLEVTNATQRYICEQQTNKELLSKLETCEKLKMASESLVNDLKRKNEMLDKDVVLLKGVLRDHEQAILTNNTSSKRKDLLIDRLNLKVSEIEQENLNLKMQLEEKLNTPLKELTEQINQLKLVEVEKGVLLKNVEEIELQRDSFIQDNNSLRIELEKISEQLAHYENLHKELIIKNKETSEALTAEIALRNSVEKELVTNQNAINDLDNRFKALNLTTEKFKSHNSKQVDENTGLVQKVDALKKEIKILLSTQEESIQKQQSLVTEKEKLTAKLKENQSLIISDMPDFHNSFVKAIQFILKILEVTMHLIGSDPYYPEAKKLKSGLLSALRYWKQGPEAIVKTEINFTEIFDDLNNFYETLANKSREELVIHDNVKLIINSVNSIGQFCESSALKYQNPNHGDITNMSMFDTTMVANFGDVTKVNLSHSSLIVELQQTKKILEEYFSSMKNTIYKQEEELEVLKARLIEISSKQVSYGTLPSEKSNNSFEGKYNLIKMNFYKLDRDYKQLLKSYSEMEEYLAFLKNEKQSLEEQNCKYNEINENFEHLTAKYEKLADIYTEAEDRIVTLEKEKQSLEEEADELANDYRKIEEQLSSNNELAETLTKLVHTQQQLKQSENENNWLKEKVQYCQSNHGKKTILGNSEGASNVLVKEDYKENVMKKGNDRFIS